MGVRRRDGGVDRRRPVLASPRRVAGAAEQAGRPHGEGGVPRPPRVEGADDVAVAGALRPLHAQGQGAAAQRLQVPRLRRLERAEEAEAAVDHDPRRGHPGEQRHLGVPVLHRQRRLEAQGVAARRRRRDLLDRHRQADAAALRLAREAQLAHLPQQGERAVGGAAVDRRPAPPDSRRPGGCAPAPAPRRRPPARRRASRSIVHRRAARSCVRQEAARALAERGRVQRRAAVRHVDGHPAQAGLAGRPRRPARPARRRPRWRSSPGTRRRGGRCGAPGRGRASRAGRS